MTWSYSVLLCSIACNEAYAYDTGTAYACAFGCTVRLDTVVTNEIVQISTINNLMDMLFVSRVVDMFSYDTEVSRDDVSEEWPNEVDVFVSEVCVVYMLDTEGIKSFCS